MRLGRSVYIRYANGMNMLNSSGIFVCPKMLTSSHIVRGTIGNEIFICY